MQDFQSLTRCLTDVDHAAVTSNSFEFLKVLIEGQISLDSVSSILQMLIRMNKSIENFIPVRFCKFALFECDSTYNQVHSQTAAMVP